jgi:multidrug resistance efflux pump
VRVQRSLRCSVNSYSLKVRSKVQKLAAIDRQRAQKEAERATITATIEKLTATIPLLQQRVDVRKHLADKELGSKLRYLTDLQDLVGQQQDLDRPYGRDQA